MHYKISNEPPEVIYQEARMRWGVNFDKGIVFTVGDTIHCKGDLPQDVLAHELVHVRQQLAYGVDLWWNEYFENQTFRFQQELEAYREQYKWVLANVKDRNQQSRLLIFYATCLSGEMYGSLLLMPEALVLIKQDVSK